MVIRWRFYPPVIMDVDTELVDLSTGLSYLSFAPALNYIGSQESFMPKGETI